MKTLICIILGLSIVLSGCDNIQKNEIPTQTIKIASKAPEIIATATVANTSIRNVNCVQVDDIVQTNSTIVGQIVIKDDKGLALCNLISGIQQSLPGTDHALYFTTSFSPDYKHFSYIDSSSNLVIVSATGEMQIIDLQESVGFWVSDWLNNQEIAFAFPTRDDGSMAIYNIDTGEFRQVITNIEDINNIDPISWYGGNTPISIIDPSLSRLIYLSNDLPGIGGHGFVMRDKETNNVLWQKAGVIGTKPAWSSNGSFAAVATNLTNKDNIYIVNRNGEEHQVISFEHDYPDADVSVQNMKWSPHGKYLAFISKISLNEKERQVLFVYNLQTKTSKQFEISNSTRIIWSPNDGQILVNGYFIDLETNQKYALTSNNESFEPLGWLETSK